MSSDEDVIIDHNPEPEYPQVLTNNNQPALWNLVSYVWSIFEGHGYLIVLGAVLAYYVYQRSVGYLEQKVQSRKNGSNNNLSPEEQMNRLEAMRKSREKLQAEVDEAAAIEAEKIKEREERQRQEKIEDWERHKKGLGYKSKTKSAEPTASNTLKPDNFNPLAGHGGSGGSFRSSRPSFNRGGGG